MNKYAMRMVSVAVAAVVAFMLTSCAGVGDRFDTPAEREQIPFTVFPITAELIANQAVPGQQSPKFDAGLQASEPYRYLIGEGDVLTILVNRPLYGAAGSSASGESEADSKYVVNESGEVFLPFHGALRVAGLTISEAYEQIRAALARFINQPQVNVRVAEFRSQRVAVVGAVLEPGYQSITNRALSFSEAMLVAGWDETADLRQVALKRGGETFVIDAQRILSSPEFGQRLHLRAGDVLVVPQNDQYVYLLGEAPNSTKLIRDGQRSLGWALVGGGSAGNAQKQNYLQDGAAKPGSIFVIRPRQDLAEVFHLDGRSPEAFILADQFQLQDRDIVFVSSRSVTRFNRFVAQLIPSLQSVFAPLFLINQADGGSN